MKGKYLFWHWYVKYAVSFSRPKPRFIKNCRTWEPPTLPPSEKVCLLFSVNWKKRFAIFPSPAGMSLTKLSLAGNNLIIPAQREFVKWLPGWGGGGRKIDKLFLQCRSNQVSLSVSFHLCPFLSSVSASVSSVISVCLFLICRHSRFLFLPS